MNTSPLIITPPVFLDLCVLCLYFECEEEGPSGKWTTIDKIARILNNLCVITDKQKRKLYHDRRVQMLFCEKSHFVYIENITLDYVTKEITKYFLIKVPGRHVAGRNLELMLKNYRIYLTRRGWNTGRILEPKYHDVLSREMFLGEIARFKALVESLKNENPGALVNMRIRYHQGLKKIEKGDGNETEI